jgi:DNA-binding transcriptional LysR family regulator
VFDEFEGPFGIKEAESMEVRQLKSFWMIATTGSFSAAADRLGLTQSALSHQIAQLEESLGTKLLVRARPNVHVTEAGEVVLATADRVLADLNEIRAQLGLELESGGTPLVRVASTALGFAYIYGDLCQAFISKYPDMKLDFSATEAPEVAISKVLTRSADIAFGPMPDDVGGVDTIGLADVEHVFIVGNSHAIRRRPHIDLCDVQRYPFVRYHRGCGSRAMSDAVFANSGYPSILTESNDTEFVKRIVSMGFGIALVPIFAVAEEIRTGVLHAFRVGNHQIMDRCALVTNKRRPLKALDKFRAVCLECRGPNLRRFSLETLDTISFLQ